MAESWTRGGYKPRDLAFHSFVEKPAGSDRWIPLRSGTYAAVQEDARHYAAAHACRVLIIALSIDATAPSGLTETALLRRGQPWY